MIIFNSFILLYNIELVNSYWCIYLQTSSKLVLSTALLVLKISSRCAFVVSNNSATIF